MFRKFLLFAALCICSVLPISIQASEPGVLSKGEFKRLDAELDSIEAEEGSEVAKGEIALARGWLKEGRQLMMQGQLKKAAVMLERLPFQIELIKALIVAGAAHREAQEVEQELHSIGKKLILLRLRYGQFVLRVRGSSLTGAVPEKLGGTK